MRGRLEGRLPAQEQPAHLHASTPGNRRRISPEHPCKSTRVPGRPSTAGEAQLRLHRYQLVPTGGQVSPADARQRRTWLGVTTHGGGVRDHLGESAPQTLGDREAVPSRGLVS